MEFVECLEFQKEASWQNEIHPVATIELGAFIEQRQRNLAFVSYSEGMKFEAESLLVVCLVQSGAEFPMHGHGSADNDSAQVFAEVWMFDWVSVHEVTTQELGEMVKLILSRLSYLSRCKIPKVEVQP
jgi:hypothetical protein